MITKLDPNNDNPNKHTSVDGGNLTSPSEEELYAVNGERGKISITRDNCTDRLPDCKWSTPCMIVWATVNGLDRLYLYTQTDTHMYTHTHMHTAIIII